MVWDDCLSVPDTQVLVERSEQISLRYLDVHGRPVDWPDLPPDLSESVSYTHLTLPTILLV